MKYKALVSAHIWLNEKGNEDIEILSLIHNDESHTDAFDGIDHALLEQIDIGGSHDYYFMAIVESKFVRHDYQEGVEYDFEYEVSEIKTIEDIVAHFDDVVY